MDKDNHLIVEECKIATIQDVGRYGYEQYGVSINGALDMYAYQTGNKILGNSLTESSIEIMVFDFSIKTLVDTCICVTGAPADVFIDNKQIKQWSSYTLKANNTLYVKNIRRGLRTYIAFGGGLNITKTLGSSSLDLVTKIGEVLSTGQKLKLKSPKLKNYEKKFYTDLKIPNYGSPWKIRVTDGPDIDKFLNQSETFLSSSYQVTSEANNVGIRLEGPKIQNEKSKEVLSQGVAIGAIQIVPDGQPIILHRGRTLTAGYPVIYTVASVDLDLVGQARPGDKLDFTHVTIDEAEKLYIEKFT